jgi:high affinity Mn2+ porin
MKYALILALLLPASSLAADFSEEIWSAHGQATVVTQGNGRFASPYSGQNSLSAEPQIKTSFTATLFLGRKLWDGADFYINPELAAGSGLSGTTGIAAFPNGEIFRVDHPNPQLNLSRAFLQQVFGLGGEQETIPPDKNQRATRVDRSRITWVAGKFSLNDYFDNNTYSHDPRTQFLNWALMDQGAWDYAADTRGYTWGLYVELNQPRWAVRFATVLVPAEANQLTMDTRIAQANGNNVEFEYRYSLGARPGTVRWLGYLNNAHMGSYREAIDHPSANLDITKTRAYRSKYGFGLNFEQEVAQDLGVFGRLGWNDGSTETWAFTEIDRSASLGASLGGSDWGRRDDRLGLAYVWSGLSHDHAEYLGAGGYGFLIGDGALSYAPEQVIETYYLFKAVDHAAISADFQLVRNPAYNQDRGPVAIASGRLHVEF